MMEFFDQCKDLRIAIVRAIAVGLDIDEHWFDSYGDAGDNTLRLLHYPEVKADVFRQKDISALTSGRVCQCDANRGHRCR